MASYINNQYLVRKQKYALLKIFFICSVLHPNSVLPASTVYNITYILPFFYCFIFFHLFFYSFIFFLPLFLVPFFLAFLTCCAKWLPQISQPPSTLGDEGVFPSVSNYSSSSNVFILSRKLFPHCCSFLKMTFYSYRTNLQVAL
jgi:hypothetical protein